MSKLNKRRREIYVVGLIPSIPYQRAKKCATEVCRYYPTKFVQPKFRGLFEFDWDEYITKQRRKYGGQLWALLRPVAVFIDKKFVGSDEDLIELVNKRFVFSLPSGGVPWETAMLEEYSRYLEKTERLHVFLEINIDRKHIGHLIFQLYSDILPKTCYNFRCLCTGDEKPELCYKGTRIHRLAKMGWIQGGDNEFITGGGGKSIYGEFGDESYCISHERRGVLSMANHGKHTNGSQFFVTLQPTVWMDRYYVAFGQLVEGVEVLKAIEGVRETYEEPSQRITISDCGILYEPTSKVYRNRIRPFQSEEARRKMRAVRREKEEEDEAEFEEPRLAPEECDVRDLDSEMDVCRYLRGLYYMFNARAKVIEPDPEEVQAAKHILEILLENVIMDVGRKVMEEIMSRVEASAFDVEDVVQELMSDLIHRTVIHQEVDLAKELVEEIITKAVAIVEKMREGKVSGSPSGALVEGAPAEEVPTDGTTADEPVAEAGTPEEPPTEESPAEETPAEETPAEETPAEETPAEETPAEETPAEETPAEETPAEETPAEETPAEETPAVETPAEETPTEETPVAETPAEETPVEETPAEETAGDGPPAADAEETAKEETTTDMAEAPTEVEA